MLQKCLNSDWNLGSDDFEDAFLQGAEIEDPRMRPVVNFPDLRNPSPELQDHVLQTMQHKPDKVTEFIRACYGFID